MTSTEIIQKKLSMLGYPVIVNGVIGTTSQASEQTRKAISMFNSDNKTYAGIYINADFLKKLDAVYISKFPQGELKPSYYKGWNADLNIKTVQISQPVIRPEENKAPVIIDQTNDSNMLYIAGAVILAGVFYVMSGKKKKRK